MPTPAGSVARLSSLLGKTLRDSPADAEIPSHQLLVRAGYIRRAAPGIYTWLPLGLATLRRVEAVVREEMEGIGAQEVLFPALLPREAYEATGRWDEYGELLFRLQDRRGIDYLLGPTHEEMFTQLVKDLTASYRDFPLILFQIQTKYRDEARPRGGIMRGREFVMADSYSFDLDDAGLDAAYARHRGAYERVFDRLGLRYRIVSAVSGAMGGSRSEEFLALTAHGGDTLAACPACGHAANVEALTFAARPATGAEHPALEALDTPGTPTIDSLAAHLGVTPAETLKNVVVTIDGQPALVLVPGDREVDVDRLAAQLEPARVELFTGEDFAAHPHLVKGYVGPQLAREWGLSVLADPRVPSGSAWVTGANRPDTHARNVVCGRDFSVDRYLDVVVVEPGDPCPSCGAGLQLERATEVGHIFQLGRKYADTFALDALGPGGAPVRITMGSYGIGVSRAVAAVAEQTHDGAGLCWPAEVAPAHVHVLGLGKDPANHDAAAALADRLAAEGGWRVLLDDRRLAPGVAFADADLMGVPVQVIVGRAWAGGQVELKVRRTGERVVIDVAALTAAVTAALAGPAG